MGVNQGNTYKHLQRTSAPVYRVTETQCDPHQAYGTGAQRHGVWIEILTAHVCVREMMDGEHAHEEEC